MLLIVLSYTVLRYLYYSAFVSTLMTQIFIRLFADVLIDQLQLLHGCGASFPQCRHLA